MNPIRVAWVCDYPAITFSHRPALANVPQSHPVPWVTVQAGFVARTPGIELHVVTIGKRFKADDDFVDDSIHFHFRRVPRLPRAMFLYQIDRHRIQRCLDQIRPDIVQGFGTEAGNGYAAANSGYPSVIFMQGIQSEINGALSLPVLLRHPRMFVPALMERRTMRRCGCYVTPTRFGGRIATKLNPSAQVHVIPSPVRPEAFAVSRQPAPRDRPELLFVASIIPAKGIETLVHALSIVARAHPAVRLHVVGSGETSYVQGTVIPLVNRLGLERHVIFEGFLTADRLLPLWSRASVFVLPTLMDTAPNVIAEAQVAGVPVVASAVGGVPDMVEQGITGLLVPPREPQQLAEAILEFLDAPELAARVAAAAREVARNRHRPEDGVRQLVALYRQMAGAPALQT